MVGCSFTNLETGPAKINIITIEIIIAAIIISKAPAGPKPIGGSAELTNPTAVKILSNEKKLYQCKNYFKAR